MLVTTCPECQTTFRLSVGILERAGGQVRCGRCAAIFDANTELREVEDPLSTARLSAAFEFDLAPDTGAPPEPDLGTALWPRAAIEPLPGSQSGPGSDPESDPAREPESSPAEGDALSEAKRDQTEAGSGGGNDRNAEPEASLALAGGEPSGPAWLLLQEEPKPWHARAWTAGVALLSLLLALQLVHHFRSALVEVPVAGPVLGAIYSVFGSEVPPNVDLGQYALLDLTAVAEPAGGERGWLIIETRVRNRGPKVQPVPHIFVRLLDRWEDTIAGRYFGPEEYAVDDIANPAEMSAGSTIDAQFIIVDPGPSATGFELELCVQRAGAFDCESDRVFE